MKTLFLPRAGGAGCKAVSFILGVDRSQTLLLPESVEEYVDPEHPVRFLDAFVDGLDLAACGFGRTEAADTGRPPFAPADLLKLYLWGYLNKVRSSRRLELECGRNLEVLWLLRKLQPDFKTIADFRRDNAKAFKAVFRQFHLLCRELELFGGELVAIDGTKLKAVNNVAQVCSAEKLRARIERIDARLAEFLATLEAGDRAESAAVPEGATASKRGAWRARSRRCARASSVIRRRWRAWQRAAKRKSRSPMPTVGGCAKWGWVTTGRLPSMPSTNSSWWPR